MASFAEGLVWYHWIDGMGSPLIVGLIVGWAIGRYTPCRLPDDLHEDLRQAAAGTDRLKSHTDRMRLARPAAG